MDDHRGDKLLATLKKLREEGRPQIEAFELARLDQLIKQWPTDWGEDLQMQLYGDLEIQVEVDLPDLGITISADKKMPKEGQSRFVFGAPYAQTSKPGANYDYVVFLHL